MASKVRVGLVFGGRSVEHAVSLNSARTVRQGLVEAGFEVVSLAISTQGRWIDLKRSEAALLDETKVLHEGDGSVCESLRILQEARVDVVFPIVHGTWGEDGTLQGLCEMLDLPYAGADVGTSAVAMDKDLCKRVLAQAGLPVVEDRVLRRNDFLSRAPEVLEGLRSMELPLFVKPSTGGSSVGVGRVTAWDDLASAIEFAFGFDDKVLVETGVSGAREVECAVIGGQVVEAAQVLGEIVPGSDFYDYEDKYLTDAAELIAPAELTDREAQSIRELAVAAFTAVGGVGMARVDFLLSDKGELFINELNTVPGFTSISMYPRLWELSGLSLSGLVERLVALGIERHQRRHQLDTGIKRWISDLTESS